MRCACAYRRASSAIQSRRELLDFAIETVIWVVYTRRLYTEKFTKSVTLFIQSRLLVVRMDSVYLGGTADRGPLERERGRESERERFVPRYNRDDLAAYQFGIFISYAYPPKFDARIRG